MAKVVGPNRLIGDCNMCMFLLLRQAECTGSWYYSFLFSYSPFERWSPW